MAAAEAESEKLLSVIGAPSSAGAYAPGQEKAPAAFRRRGLLAALDGAGIDASDLGDITGFRWRPDLERPDAANIEVVRQLCLEVADKVEAALRGNRFALVLGGDCTIEIGVVGGAQRLGGSVGLIYIDRDADLNPPAESDGALDWTGVAHLLAIDGAAPELAELGAKRPMLSPREVLYFGLDNLERREAETMARLGLTALRRAEIEAAPVEAALKAVEWARAYDRLLIHLDVDVLDFVDFPFAENVRREPGLSFDALAAALPVLVGAPNARALTITEVNPDHAPEEAVAFRRFNAMLASALSS